MKNKNYLALFANLMIPIGGISTDIYLPSLPAMTEHFMVSKALVQLTIGFFVFAMAIGQFIAGVISDALGRKKLIIISLITQLICIIGILTTSSIYFILFYRVIQGFAVAFMMVPSRAIINDLFEGIELQKKLSYLTISFSMSPILAPFLGGYLQHYFGWQANFYFILIYIAFVFFLVLLTLPETIASTKPFSLSHFISNTAIIGKNKFFLSTSIFAGLMMAYTTLFSLLGPFMVQTVLGQTAVIYGYTAFIVGGAWFLGNMLNRIFIGINKTLQFNFLLWSTFSIIMIMLFMAMRNYFNLFSLITPIFFIALASAWLFGSCVAKGLSIFKELAASANACFFSIAWFVFGIISVIATFLKVHSLIPLALTFLGINIICLILFSWMLRTKIR